MFVGAHAARVQTTDLTSCIPLSIVARETNPGWCEPVKPKTCLKAKTT